MKGIYYKFSCMYGDPVLDWELITSVENRECAHFLS
jgi:hypothetical protein